MATPGRGPTYDEVAHVSALPAGVQLVDGQTFDDKVKGKPWYRQWWPYAIAGGVAVVGGGTALVLRHRKRG